MTFGIYYLDTIEIGKYNKKIIENNIIFRERTVEDELAKQIRDVVISIDLNKKEISLTEEKEKEKRLIEETLKLDKDEEIKQIVTVDLKQPLKERSTVKDVNIKQEMNTNSRVTDMKNLGQVLDREGVLPHIEGKTFTKIGIIESDDRDKLLDENGNKSKVNTTRYSMVAIANDGSVVPLEAEQDHQEGNNPNEKNYQVSQKGEIKQDAVLSRFNIGEGSIAIKNGEYGEIKVYHSPRKTIGGKNLEGNKSLDRQLETNNVWQLKKEEMDLAEEYGDGYRSVEESYQEAKLHEDDSGKIIDEKKMKVEDIDGETNTKSHEHEKIDYNTLAVKWGYYKDSVPNLEKAKEMFEEKRKENPNKNAKEIIEMVTDDLEKEFGYSKDER